MSHTKSIVTRSLINTFQREVKPEKLFSVLTSMNDLLDESYDFITEGPLPAIDGFNLTRLNAASLEGDFPPGFNIAYLDEINAFSRGQRIVLDDGAEPFLIMGFGDDDPENPVVPSSYFRVGTYQDSEFFISQNVSYDAGFYTQDDAADGSLLIEFIAGTANIKWWDSVLGDFRNTWEINGPEILCSDDADNASYSFVIRDANDVFRLGEDCATDGAASAGYIAIPAKPAAQIPPSGSADADGIIVIDKTTNYLVFYHSGLRYRVAGVAYP